MDGFCTDTANKMSEVCSYCGIIALRCAQSLHEKMLLSMRGDERLCPFGDIENKHVSLLFNSPSVQGFCQQ